jgi:cytochrome c oxidase subunit 3
MTHATATLDQMRPPVPAEPGLPIYNNKLGMWVFLASEVMFFTGLIGAYVILRFGAPGEWAKPNVVLNVPLTGINTFILICSSVSMVKAFAAISAGDRKGLSRWLLATILLGATFVSVQGVEYWKLVHEGFTPAGFTAGSHITELVAQGKLSDVTGGLYGSTFFTMTGFHGFHVTCGVICLIYVWLKSLRGGYTQQDYRGVEVIGLYWHFVDLVWIILFTIVYLI